MSRLTLIGQAPEDVPAISALLQDAALRVPDVRFEPRRRRLVLIFNRFRWEAPEPSRVRTALRIETVALVRHQHWPTDPGSVLALLSLAHEPDRLTLIFAGTAVLRVGIEVVELCLEDLGEPWPTRRRPVHD